MGLKNPRTRFNKALVTIKAVNTLMMIPSASVIEKPFTIVAPKALPNQKRIPQVINTAMFESRIEGQARFQPKFMDCCSGFPARSSSLMRSKTRMFASRADPVLNKNPAIHGKVSVIGINRNNA